MLAWRREIAAKQLTVPDGQAAGASVPRAMAVSSSSRARSTSLTSRSGRRPVRRRCAQRSPMPDHILVPGQFVKVELLDLKRDGAILVPQRAVQQGLTGSYRLRRRATATRLRSARSGIVVGRAPNGSWTTASGPATKSSSMGRRRSIRAHGRSRRRTTPQPTRRTRTVEPGRARGAGNSAGNGASMSAPAGGSAAASGTSGGATPPSQPKRRSATSSSSGRSSRWSSRS